MRVPINKSIDPSVLSERLTTILGRGVALSVRMPGQVDDRGAPLPGVIVLLDDTTGEPLDLPSGTLTAIQAAIAAHVPPPPEETPAKALSTALGAVTTVEHLRTALVAYAGAIVDREDQARQRRPVR